MDASKSTKPVLFPLHTVFGETVVSVKSHSSSPIQNNIASMVGFAVT